MHHSFYMPALHLPPYAVFPEIAGDIIGLRSVQDEDIKDLVEISFYDAVQASSLEEAAAMHQRINADYVQGNSIHWAIVHYQLNRIVGTCGYYRGLSNGEGELGCILLPRFRGRGVMEAALQLAIQFGLGSIGLNRIYATTTYNNLAAIKLLHRLGFTKSSNLAGDKVEYEISTRV
jgi:[ribosomal protein S5]-alanine N-acetyltransferase